MTPFFTAFLASATFTYLIRELSQRTGLLTRHRSGRWNEKSIPSSGGIAIFLAFMIASLASGLPNLATLGILAGALIAFLLGLVDDLLTISPPVKLAGQIVAASTIVYTGTVTVFFESSIPNLLISIFWLVAMSNALNLLDNMDGLSTTTTLVAASFLAYFFFLGQNADLLPLALAIAGAALGFLLFNFPPASIFMGDSGSLFLGITLAGLAIAKEPQASNIFAVMGVPLLILMLPILDTTMVSITRLLRGQSPAVGGRDHMSHRLVSLGLSERRVVLLLAGISLVSGLLAVALEGFSYALSLLLIPVAVVLLALFTAYLAQIGLDEDANTGKVFSRLLVVSNTSSRFHLVEIVLDLVILTVAYYAAFIIRFGAPLGEINTQLFIDSIPVVLVSGLLAFLLLRLYRTVWKYSSIADVLRIAQAALLSALAAAFVIVILFRFEGFSRQVFLVFPVILFLLLAASRFSFRIIDSALEATQSAKGVPVLIYGAGSGGELAIREIQRNRNLNYAPVGFIDDDKGLQGRQIHGVPVLGSIDGLEQLVEQTGAKGIIISSGKIDLSDSEPLNAINSTYPDFWKKQLIIGFQEI